MWSPIAPLHGFAIEVEAIIPRRGAYHISIRPKNSSCCEDSHKTLRSGSMPAEVPLVGTPGWTREVVYRELPNMHTLFGDSIFLRSKQQLTCAEKGSCSTTMPWQGARFRRSPMAIVGGRGNREIKINHFSNFRARELTCQGYLPKAVQRPQRKLDGWSNAANSHGR